MLSRNLNLQVNQGKLIELDGVMLHVVNTSVKIKPTHYRTIIKRAISNVKSFMNMQITCAKEV